MSWFGDFGKKKAKPKPKAEILEIPKIEWTESDEQNVMYDLSVNRLERKQIFGDKDMDKGEIINWISVFIKENEKQYTLDFLRGQKLIYETINEMRKEGR